MEGLEQVLVLLLCGFSAALFPAYFLLLLQVSGGCIENCSRCWVSAILLEDELCNLPTFKLAISWGWIAIGIAESLICLVHVDPVEFLLHLE